MRKLVFLTAFLATASAAFAWDLSGSSQTKLWSAQPGNAMSLGHATDLRAWGNPKSGLELEGGFRYELDHEAWDDTSHFRGISRKHLRLTGSLGYLAVGNYHATLGRGLALNCVEERKTGTDRDLEGADISLSLAELLEVRLLGGWLRENASMDTTRSLAGGQAGLAVFRNLGLSAVYLRANAGDRRQAEVFGRPVEEIYGGAVRAGYGPFDVYAEFDLRRTYGKLVDPTAGWEGADDVRGQAGYLSASFTVPGLGVSVDAKDYRRFDAGFNAPPAANREGWLLNSGYDEQGYQAQATATPWKALTLSASLSRARSRQEYRWAFLPEFPEDSTGRYGWRDYHLEAKWAAGRSLTVGAEARARRERNLQPDVKLRSFQGGGLEAAWMYGRGRSLEAQAGLDRFANHYIDGDLGYLSLTAGLKWSPFDAISVFGNAELADRRVPEYEHQRRWGEAGLDLKLGGGGHHITVSAGQTKGGLVCSGGFCRFEPSFRGMKASWEWKF